MRSVPNGLFTLGSKFIVFLSPSDIMLNCVRKIKGAAGKNGDFNGKCA